MLHTQVNILFCSQIWIQKKKLTKVIILQDTNEKGFDVSRFTISLCQSDTTVTWTENWRWKMLKTTAVQKEVVLDCVDIFESNFIYQMNNACYKSYTLESVQKSD